MQNKKIITLILIGFMILPLFAAPVSLSSNREVVATVRVGNKTETITRSELEERKEQYKNTGSNATEAEILDIMINDKVFLMNAAQEGITVTDAQIDEQIAQARQTLEKQAGSMVTDSQLETLIQRQYGMSMAQLRESMRSQAILGEYLRKHKPDEINKTFTATDAEVLEFYNVNKQQFVSPDAVRLAHVFKAEVKDNAKANADNRKILQDVLLRIQKNQITFEKAVQDYSDQDAANSRANGGSIGWVGYAYKSMMGDEFINAAMSLKPGEVYGSVVHSPLGYHIIKATSTQEMKFLKLDDFTSPESNTTVREYIRTNLANQKQQEHFVTITNALVDDLVSKARITNNLKK